VLVIIDNYDSFTYNLVQYFGELGEDVAVYRNDAISVPELAELSPNYLVISPGPCTPNEAGISMQAIQYFSDKLPILGVCLGHQSIAQVFGGSVVKAKNLMHGKVSSITHNQCGLFADIDNPFAATRYHSLAVQQSTLPECLEITASTDDNEIMGVQHRSLPVCGVQFHPESIETQFGYKLLENFLSMQSPLSVAG
jgi:anthranilate synthase/aminodeoxychorismate synthase-like glutamine amidotransferase